MEKIFIETSIFSVRWKELGLTEDDLLELQKFILKNPEAGNIIQGTGGLTKLRFALPNTGKSGGVRVLFVNFIRQEKIIFVNCYSKSDTDNVSNKEKAMYRTLIRLIKEELK